MINTITLYILIISTILITILFSVGYMAQKRVIFSRQKSSPYECGFDPNASARIPFSLRLFLLAVILLVFDVEIALLMGVPISLTENFLVTSLITSILLMILLVGLLHEWREGSLEWN